MLTFAEITFFAEVAFCFRRISQRKGPSQHCLPDITADEASAAAISIKTVTPRD